LGETGRCDCIEGVPNGNAEEHPIALKTPFEVCLRPYFPLIAWLTAPQRALAQTPWKEYFQQGRKFYYNVCVTQGKILLLTFSQTATKESKWEMPEELLLILEKVEKETGPLPPPT